MKHIVSISFATDVTGAGAYFDQIIKFQGHEVRVTQYSTGLDVEATAALIAKFDGQVDVICLSGLPPKTGPNGKPFVHPEAHRLKTMAKETRIADGQLLKEIYLPWALRQFHLKHPHILAKKKIGLYAGALQKNVVEVLEELEAKTVLADPYYFLKLPFNIHSNKELERFISLLAPFLKRVKLKRGQLSAFSMPKGPRPRALREFFSNEVFVGNLSNMLAMDLRHLKGKTLVIDYLSHEFKEVLKSTGVHKVVVCLPEIAKNIKGPHGNYALFEALLSICENKGEALSQDELLEKIAKYKLAPRMLELNKIEEDVRHFAFIVHPLSSAHLFRHPYLKMLKERSQLIEKPIETALDWLPGFYWGHLSGIQSEKNGVRAYGHIYMLPSTPKKLVSADPERVYKKLVSLCYDAKEHGAKIIGLGAYTKIVGDAGVTVAKRGPIPVTTGNALSAAATLWAAKYAILKMGLVKMKKGKAQGKVMVVGATGSIGAVSAKILAREWEEVILVAPRPYRLLELKEEILKIVPSVKINVATDPNPLLGECDLIITTTSGQGKKVLDIMCVRPGAVICDVARPFDIKAVDAMKRPDVMVIASGEVELPGDVEIKADMALEGKIVYACLAETALLALEGRYESFTLSRNISYEKVLEIERMAIDHGVKLSAITGHHGPISDDEFLLCRLHALKRRADVKK